MPPTSSIVIQNKSGAHDNYAIYAAAPDVSGAFDVAVTPVVIYSILIPQGGRCQVEFTPKHSAVWGTYAGPPKALVPSTVEQSQSVKLVELGADGEISSQGSKVVLKVNDELQPSFGSKVESTDGSPGSFQLVTESFDASKAKDNNWFVGIAIESDVGLSTLGSWTPRPNVEYEVKPRFQFYVVADPKLKTRAVVNPETLKDRACSVDFYTHGTNNIILVHDSSGKISIQG